MRKTLYTLILLFTYLSVGYSSVYDDLTESGEYLPTKGIWIDKNTIAINDWNSSYYDYELFYSSDFSMKLHRYKGLQDGIPLKYIGEFYNEGEKFNKKFAYVEKNRYGKFDIDVSVKELKEIVKSQIVIAKKDRYTGKTIELFAPILTGVLDENFAVDSSLLGVHFDGDTPEFRVWAPTSTNVKLRLYADPSYQTELDFSPLEMYEQDNVWYLRGDASWHGAYYKYEITNYKRKQNSLTTELVTDIYSVNVSMNSEFSHIIDIDKYYYPEGWSSDRVNEKFPYESAVDASIYELHLRDFSIFDKSQPEEFRGKFKAFTNQSSIGVNHLKQLADSGVTHIHMLPVTDIASIEEDESKRVDLSLDDIEYLESNGASSEEQQSIASRIRKKDGYNWGYDPIHYMVPEGSYSTNPNGPARIVEFREMIQSLHNIGLRFVLDVVFNHYADLSLNKTVPDYYYNMNSCGDVTTESCCPDLATENEMVKNLIVTSVYKLAKRYHIDSFRFDLMGFISKTVMEEIRSSLDSLTLEKDGVDGKSILLYGEGWHFGPLVGKVPNEAMTQYGAASTDLNVATFNDRFRDAVKGKGQNSFDLFVDDAFITDKTNQRENVLMGLMGSLKGIKNGYVNNPVETINYITAHDKSTLWDTLVAKVGPYASTSSMVKIHQLGLSMLTFAQGIPFYHAGVEILRSKSGDENSYDSGDWFNRLDYSMQTHNWAKGLPPRWVHENHAAWGNWRDRLNYIESPSKGFMQDTFEHFKDINLIRKSSKLFRLKSKGEVLAKVSLPAKIYDEYGNFDSKLIAVKIDDTKGKDLDPAIDKVWIVFNSSWDKCINFYDADLDPEKFELHPILKRSRNRFTQESLKYQCDNKSSLRAGFLDAKAKALKIPPQSTLIFYTRQ